MSNIEEQTNMYKWLSVLITLMLISCSNQKPAPQTPTVVVSAEPSFELPEPIENVEWKELENGDPILTSIKNGKFVFMFFYVVGCQPCDEAEAVFNDEEVATGLNDIFFPVKINAQTNLDMYLNFVTPAFNDYPIVTVPSTTIVGSDGHAFVLRGVISKEVILKIIEKAQGLRRKHGIQKSASVSQSVSP